MSVTDLLHGFLCKARKGLAPEVILAQGEVSSEQAPAHGAVRQKGNAKLSASWNQIPLQAHSLLLETKRREKTMPFEVTLMRSQVLYRAAQDSLLLCDLACYILGSCPNCATVCKFPRQVIEHNACIHMTFGLSKRRHTHVRCSLQR